MSIWCLIEGHEPGEEQVWNRGYLFSKCRRCATDMIRSDGDWTIVPPGHRVVWKSGRHEHSRPAAYSRNLPVLYRAAKAGLPALWWEGGWYKQVLALAGGGTAERLSGPAAQAEEAERDGRQLPYVLAAAAVLGAGIQLLFASRGRG